MVTASRWDPEAGGGKEETGLCDLILEGDGPETKSAWRKMQPRWPRAAGKAATWTVAPTAGSIAWQRRRWDGSWELRASRPGLERRWRSTSHWT